MKARNLRKLEPKEPGREESSSPLDDGGHASPGDTLGLNKILGFCEKQLEKLDKSDKSSAPRLDSNAPVSLDMHGDMHGDMGGEQPEDITTSRSTTTSKRPLLTYEQIEEALEERVNGDRRVKSVKPSASFVERRMSQRRQS